MASDVSKPGAHKRAIELQKRILAAGHPILLRNGANATAKNLWREIRSHLIKASDCGLIKESQTYIHENLVLSDQHLGGGTHSIAVGSVRNFNRVRSLPHFTRKSDGAWFDFQLSVKQIGSSVEILAYDFEIRFENSVPVSFIRFDLNPKNHNNELDGMRCHMHLASDDDGHAVPSPIMSPYEILDILLHGVTRTGRIRREADTLSGLE